MNGDDPSFERIPGTRELAAQYLIFLDLALPPRFDLGTSTNVDRSEALVSARPLKASSSDVRELAGRPVGQWLQQNAPNMMTEAAGVSVAYAYITERNIEAMLRGSPFCLLLLSVILLFYLGSVRIVLISLIPNLVPALMAFGFWGYVRGDVNLAVSVVGAMTLGIVVDDTVHVLSKYAHAPRPALVAARSDTPYLRTGRSGADHDFGNTVSRIRRVGDVQFCRVQPGRPDVGDHHCHRPDRRPSLSSSIASSFWGYKIMIRICPTALLHCLGQTGLARAETPQERGLRVANAVSDSGQGFGSVESFGDMMLKDR